MNPETVQEIRDALEPLAEVANQGAEFSWEVLVRQAVLQGITDIIAGVVLAIVAVLFLRHFLRALNRYQQAADDDQSRRIREDEALPCVPFGIATLLAGSLALAFIIPGILRLANPGYYAIKEITKVVGG